MRAFTSSSGITYTVTGPARSGGQAEVFPATSAPNGTVALKVARDSGPASASLRREGKELRRLIASHAELTEYLVPVLDAGENEGGRHVLVLPWFEQDLHTWLQGRSLLERLRAAEAACLAVTRLHRSARNWRVGVVHRDIKPRNLLVADPGGPRLRLADFGGVWRANGSSSVASGFHTIGYAPPDQALPGRGEPARSWDVYALAVTVFECLVGRVPIGTRAATYAYTHEGHELLALMERDAAGPLTPAQQQRLQHLTGLGVQHLVDLERVEPLAALDREVLRSALAVAPTAMPELMDALDDALEPDPALRQSDARPLGRAVAAALRRVVRAQNARRTATEAHRPTMPDSVNMYVHPGTSTDQALPPPEVSAAETVAPAPRPPKPAPKPPVAARPPQPSRPVGPSPVLPGTTAGEPARTGRYACPVCETPCPSGLAWCSGSCRTSAMDQGLVAAHLGQWKQWQARHQESTEHAAGEARALPPNDPGPAADYACPRCDTAYDGALAWCSPECRGAALQQGTVGTDLAAWRAR